MEEADLDRIMGEPVPGNPGLEAQLAEAEKPADMSGWRRSIILVVFGTCLGSLGNIALLLYMNKQVEPETPYKLAFWIMMGNWLRLSRRKQWALKRRNIDALSDRP